MIRKYYGPILASNCDSRSRRSPSSLRTAGCVIRSGVQIPQPSVEEVPIDPEELELEQFLDICPIEALESAGVLLDAGIAAIPLFMVSLPGRGLGGPTTRA